MPATKSPRISARKQPQQTRSSDLVEAVLQAAVQVLVEEGAPRFTMARVAERAGASVGSLYQYFPNKAAILFRLQSDEWRETSAMLKTILEDRAMPPLDRVRALVRAFVQSECEEAAVRIALDDAAPFYRDAPEAQAARETGRRAFTHFMAEALPDATPATRHLAADLLKAAVTSTAKQFSESPRTAEEIDAYSAALADMCCAYLRDLGAR